jgi:hypothetical protein
VTRAQRSARFRLRRQHLDPVDGGGAVEIAHRLCGVQAQVASSAQLAVAVRQARAGPRDVEVALEKRTLVKTWAMRGTLHYLPAGEAQAWLAPLAALRSWEKASWQQGVRGRPGGSRR